MSRSRDKLVQTLRDENVHLRSLLRKIDKLYHHRVPAKPGAVKAMEQNWKALEALFEQFHAYEESKETSDG